MKTLKQISFGGILLLLFSCNSSPIPIEYGIDGCHFCKMTIVDKIHGAEIVTKKGKVYKFDAAECMIHFLEELDQNEIAFYLTNSFDRPTELVDATKAHYLVSENIPSPMGEFLTAFKNIEEVNSILSDKGGKLYSWEEIQRVIKNKK